MRTKQKIGQKWYPYRLYFTANALVGLITMLAAGIAAAQTSLEEAVRIQLQNFCQVFRQGDNTTPISNVGPNLNALCPAPPSGPPAPGPSGSGAAGFGSAAMQPQFLFAVDKRRRKAGGEDDTDGARSADSSIDIGNGFSAFLSVDYTDLDKSRSSLEDGYNSDIWGVTFGADYQINPWFLAGLAFNFNRWDGNYNQGGNFETDSYGPIIFASFFPHEQIFIDLVGGYTRKDYERSRRAAFFDVRPAPDVRVSGISTADYNGDEYQVSILAGYDYPMGNVTVGPRIGVNYTHLDVDSFTEKGSTGLEIRQENYDITSLQSVVELQASTAISTVLGVLVPQINAAWIHEFDNDQRSISVRFAEDFRANPSRFDYQTENPDTDFFRLGAGFVVSLPLRHQIQIFAQYETIRGKSRFDSHGGTIGLRANF